jgi:hypothetical protein
LASVVVNYDDAAVCALDKVGDQTRQKFLFKPVDGLLVEEMGVCGPEIGTDCCPEE